MTKQPDTEEEEAVAVPLEELPNETTHFKFVIKSDDWRYKLVKFIEDHKLSQAGHVQGIMNNQTGIIHTVFIRKSGVDHAALAKLFGLPLAKLESAREFTLTPLKGWDATRKPNVPYVGEA